MRVQKHTLLLCARVSMKLPTVKHGLNADEDPAHSVYDYSERCKALCSRTLTTTCMQALGWSVHDGAQPQALHAVH